MSAAPGSVNIELLCSVVDVTSVVAGGIVVVGVVVGVVAFGLSVDGFVPVVLVFVVVVTLLGGALDRCLCFEQ